MKYMEISPQESLLHVSDGVRQCARVPFTGRVMLQDVFGGGRRASRALNLSQGGLLVEDELRQDVGAMVRAEIPCDGRAPIVTIMRVVRVEMKGGCVYTGLAFVELNATVRSRLECLMSDVSDDISRSGEVLRWERPALVISCPNA